MTRRRQIPPSAPTSAAMTSCLSFTLFSHSDTHAHGPCPSASPPHHQTWLRIGPWEHLDLSILPASLGSFPWPTCLPGCARPPPQPHRHHHVLYPDSLPHGPNCSPVWGSGPSPPPPLGSLPGTQPGFPEACLASSPCVPPALRTAWPTGALARVGQKFTPQTPLSFICCVMTVASLCPAWC